MDYRFHNGATVSIATVRKERYSAVVRGVGGGNPVTGESAHGPGSTHGGDVSANDCRNHELATRQRRAAARTSTQQSHGEFASGAVAFAVGAAVGTRAGRSAAPAGCRRAAGDLRSAPGIGRGP